MDIQYKGYTAQPSDYLCEDGHLEATIDMVPAGGSLHPFKRPKALGLTLDPETQNIFIHQTASYTHYIIYDTDGGNIRLYHLDTLDGSAYPLDGDNYPDDCNLFYTMEGQEMQSITAVGNIIIISTDTQLAYFRWNATGAIYAYIGDSVPDPDITFALASELAKKTYSDCEYEIEDADGSALANSNGHWTVVATGSIDWYKEGNKLDYNKAEFTGLTVEANTNYRYYFTGYSGTAGRITVYGTNVSTGEVEVLHTTRAKDCQAFSFADADQTVDHTDIYMEFGLSSDHHFRTSITIQKGSSIVYGKVVKYTEDGYNAMMGCVNDFVASKGAAENKFTHPFFVRYAVRLYDGSYSYISPPALLLPNTAYAPYVFYNYDGNQSKRVALLVSYVSELQYKQSNAVDSDWDDIVKGVDIFVSQPIYPYDQGLEYDEEEDRFTYLMYNCVENSSDRKLINELGNFNYTIGTVSLAGADVSDVGDRHGRTEGHLKRDIYDYIKKGGKLSLFSGEESDALDGIYNVVLPAMRSDEEMLKEYTSVAAYYRIAQLSANDLRNEDGRIVTDDEGFATLEIETGVLETLAAQETLDEDNLSFYTCRGASLYSYNNRLHVFNAQTEYRPPKCLHSLNTFMTATDDDGRLPDGSCDIEYTYPISDIWVYIKTEEGDRCAHLDGDNLHYTRENFFWFFYPEARAYKAIIRHSIYRTTYLTARKKTKTTQYVEIPLTSHDFTTGAYAFVLPTVSVDYNVLSSVDATISGTFPADTVPGSTLLRGSTIYVSEASNPFVFTASSTVSVGAEAVYALATAAQPLSVGQFGEFPLYAFTSEGVWAFSLSDTGVYTARQPITRDVCVNPEHIAQLDRSVLFATDRGVMELSGSNCECITDAIDNRLAKFDVLSLKNIDELLSTVHTSFLSDAIAIADMRAFMASCRIAYDYTHRRLFFSNPELSSSGGTTHPYTYVYDIAGGQWSFVSTVIASTTNSYPESICILNDRGVVDFCQEDDTSPIHCAALTRPMKFGQADIHKTVRTIIQRGIFPAGVGNEVDGLSPVRQVLYGSNDLINWQAVASSNKHYLRNYSGTAYKFYRVLLLNYLKPGDNIAGMSIDVVVKRNNQLR